MKKTKRIMPQVYTKAILKLDLESIKEVPEDRESSMTRIPSFRPFATQNVHSGTSNSLSLETTCLNDSAVRMIKDESSQ